MNKKGGFTAIMVIMACLIILATTVIFLVWQNKVQQEDNQINVTEIITYPMKIQSKADDVLNYYIFDSSGIEVEFGELRPNVLETFNDNLFNESYEIRVIGENHYYTSVNCRQDVEESICYVDPIKIGVPKISIDNLIFSIDVGDDLIREALLCVRWNYPITSIKFKEMQIEPIPSRLGYLVDRCFYLGNVQGVISQPLQINSLNRDKNEIYFYIIDKEVDRSFKYTYEEDYGLEDIVFAYNYSNI